MIPKCVITGCTLIFGYQQQHGDLFELGDTWIFNACGEPQERALLLPEIGKHVAILDSMHRNYFERRNVYVFSKNDAYLSPEAKKYIAKEFW